MAIDQITSGDTAARTKMNLAITQANLVASKADQTALDALTATVTGKATQTALDALTTTVSAKALQTALDAEAATRAAADAAMTTTVNAALATFVIYTEASGEYSRPGDAPRFFATGTDGAASALTAVDSADVTNGDYGNVLKVDGAGVVSPLGFLRVEPDREYRVRYVFYRKTDTLDPANDAVRLAVRWLTKTGAGLSTTVLSDVVDLDITDGRQEFMFTLGASDSADVAAPTGAVYVRPFIQTYGSGETHIEVIETTDLSDAVDYSPDVTTFTRELASIRYIYTDLSERFSVAEANIELSKDATWFVTGDLDDARLSDNVSLLDADQTVTGEKTFTQPLRGQASVLVGDGLPTGSAATARLIGDVNYFSIQPTDRAGGYNATREFGYNADTDSGVWTAKGGFTTTGNFSATGNGTIGGTFAATGNATFGGTLGVTGVATFSASVQMDVDLAVDGDVTIVGGSIDSTSITTLPDPVDAGDAANKRYVDTVAQGLDPKASVRAATSSNITLSGAQTIDGVSVIAGDRVLVKAQTAPEENGIYVAAAGAWSRALDFDEWSEIPGAFTFVEEGSTLGDSGWTCTADEGGTLDTTAIAWSQFAGVGTYTAGTGLTLTGREFAVSDAELLALAGLTSAADRLPYFTGSGTASLATLTAAGRAIIDDADATAQRTTLGVVIGTDVQAYNDDIAAIAALSPANDDIIQRKAGVWTKRTVQQFRADLIRQYTDTTDASTTWTSGAQAEERKMTGTLTADRTITFSTVGALSGARFRVTRTGGGAFNLSLGGLKNLATGEWGEVIYDGSAWYLAAYGAL